MQSRLKFVDVAKGIAIILVVLGHINLGDNFICNWIYSFHMPIFFIVAGFFMESRVDNTRGYIISESKKLLYPYFTFSILALLYLSIKFILGAIDFSILSTAIIDTVSLNGYSALWFLPTLFFSKIFNRFIEKCKFNKYIYGLLLIFICIQNYFGVVDLISFSILKTIYIFISRIIISILFLKFGSLCKKIVFNNNLNVYLCIIFIIISLFISQLNGLVDLHYLILNNSILYFCFAFINSCLILFFSKNIENIKILEFFGKNSLIVYGTHLTTPLIMMFEKTVQLMKINEGIIFDFAVLLMIMGIEIIIILLINKYFKFFIRYPFIKTK